MNRLCQKDGVLLKLPKDSMYIYSQSFLKRNLQKQENFVQPYEKIPKVKGFPLIGTLMDYLTMEKETTQIDLFTDRIKTYGSIYREQLPFGEEVLFTASPEDFEKVFKDEERGVFKRRLPLWSFQAFAKKHGTPNALFDMTEGEFFRRKEAIKKAILVPKEVAKLTSMYSEVTQDFMRYLENQKENGIDDVHDMLKHLQRWAFECAGITVFRKRLGALNHNEIQDKSAKKLFQGLDKFFVMFYKLEVGLPHHKTMKTTLWKQFENQMSLQFEGARELVERHQDQVVDRNANLSLEERVSTCIDILRASIDTTAETAMWALYEMSKHPEVQNNIYREITSNIGDDETLDNKIIQKAPYVRACLREIFRLHPLSPMLSRRTQSDLILSGYNVPRETVVMMLLGNIKQNEIFEDSNAFKPERWMKIENKQCPIRAKPNPFAVMPFGHGIRGCMGRRLAENELYCLFAILFKQFKLQCHRRHVRHTYKFIKTIDEPVSFRLERR